jgi:hypothetical protein
MAIINIHTKIQILLTVIALVFPTPANGFFFGRCPGTERCLFGLFVVMREGVPGTDQCTDYCVFFQDITLECGSCGPVDAVPTTSPKPTVPPVPTAPVNSEFEISLSYVGIPSSDQDTFTKAAQRWGSIVVEDLPSVSRSRLRKRLSSGCVAPIVIDDLYICARYVQIDGSGTVLGSAGPLDTRSNSLTISGEMEFDVADIAYLKNQGNFESVILHEMGHILGT